jgi:uncharacterized membrane protein YgcG
MPWGYLRHVDDDCVRTRGFQRTRVCVCSCILCVAQLHQSTQKRIQMRMFVVMANVGSECAWASDDRAAAADTLPLSRTTTQRSQQRARPRSCRSRPVPHSARGECIRCARKLPCAYVTMTVSLFLREALDRTALPLAMCSQPHRSLVQQHRHRARACVCVPSRFNANRSAQVMRSPPGHGHGGGGGGGGGGGRGAGPSPGRGGGGGGGRGVGRGAGRGNQARTAVAIVPKVREHQIRSSLCWWPDIFYARTAHHGLRYHDPHPIGRLLALSESPHKIASLSIRFVAPTHSTLDSTLHIL